MKRGVTWGSAALTVVVAAAPFVACGVTDGDLTDCGSYVCGEGPGDRDADPAWGDGDPGADAALPFEAASPAIYVPKVKNILTGLATTDAEVAAVVADPNALRDLIGQWMALPEFGPRARDFFRNAFQQNQVTVDQLSDANGQGANFGIANAYKKPLERTLMDSFPLTVWDLVSNHQPLTDALTTDTYELTTAQLVLLSFFDSFPRDDAYAQKNLLAGKLDHTITFDEASTATLAQSIDPAHPNFMIWPQKAAESERCDPGKVVVAADAGGRFTILLRYLFGLSRCQNPVAGSVTSVDVAPVLTDEDFTVFRPVQIVPAGGDATKSFWDVPALRTTTKLKLHNTRIGFGGTLAFSANWPTNSGNEARVIANQMLIVGIGRSINGEGALASFPVGVSTTDQEHATQDACKSCHIQLDPLKQYVRQTQTFYYGEQKNDAQTSSTAAFAIDGVTAAGHGLQDFMSTMAAHPRFATAWTNKLYFWGTSHPADETDPEFVRVADAFRASGHDFQTLVRDLFSSPLITYAAPTKSTDVAGGATSSIARRDQFCTALSNRLGLNDVCAMTTPLPSKDQKAIAQTATMIAADGYFRAFELPALPTTPDLFFRASTESICAQVADLVIDAPTSSRYDSTQPDAAIADFVTTVMNLPPADPRATAAKQILTDHLHTTLTDVGDAGAPSAADALKSTFQLACLAPSSVIVGL